MRATRDHIAAEAAGRLHITLDLARAVMDACLGAIGDHVAAGDSVYLYGFGTFEPRHHGARRVMPSPVTGNREYTVPERTGIGFRGAEALRRAIASVQDARQ